MAFRGAVTICVETLGWWERKKAARDKPARPSSPGTAKAQERRKAAHRDRTAVARAADRLVVALNDGASVI